MASRGCAFDCSFCGSKDVWLRKVRFRRVEDVVTEIQHGVHVLGFERFHFYDDDFLISRDYTRELCERIISEGLRFRWVCLVTVWALLKNRDLLPLLRKAGCAGIEFGFESADLSVLQTVGKRQTPDEIIETFRLIRETGFEYVDPEEAEGFDDLVGGLALSDRLKHGEVGALKAELDPCAARLAQEGKEVAVLEECPDCHEADPAKPQPFRNNALTEFSGVVAADQEVVIVEVKPLEAEYVNTVLDLRDDILDTTEAYLPEPDVLRAAEAAIERAAA
jgi:hypothetical protein